MGSCACGTTLIIMKKYIPGLPRLVGAFSDGLSFGAKLLPAKIVRLNTTLQSQLRYVTSCDEASSQLLRVSEATIMLSSPERLRLRILLSSPTPFGESSLTLYQRWETPYSI